VFSQGRTLVKTHSQLSKVHHAALTHAKLFVCLVEQEPTTCGKISGPRCNPLFTFRATSHRQLTTC